MKLFVPLDVEFATDPKILAAGPLAAYLYIVSLAHAKRNPSTDGGIHASQLPVLAVGLPGKPAKHAAVLVAVGLWKPTAQGWVIAAWTKHNATAAELTASAELASEAGAFGAHQRHHVNEKKPNPKCRWCIKDHIDKAGVPHSPPNGDGQWGRIAKEEVEGQVEVEEEVEGSCRDQVSDNSTPENTPEGVDNSRRSDVLDLYARMALDAAMARGAVRSETGYLNSARNTASNNPDLDRWIALFPTAPASAVACWLTGDKHSMSYYQRADEDPDNDNPLATIHHLRTETA